LNLTEVEKSKLDEALAKQQTITQLTTEAKKYEAKLNLAKEMAKNSTNKNEKKKAEKSIPKLEKEFFSRKFTAAELTENVNDNYYKLYEAKFTDIRPKDKSEEAKQGKQLEKNANKKYIQAKQLREKSFITENPYIAYNYLLQADSIEKSAIEDQEKAFGLYLKLKPLDDEIKEYAEKHPKKQSIDDLIVIKTTADITPISKEELAQIEEKQSNKNLTTNNIVNANNNETVEVSNHQNDSNKQNNNNETLELNNNQTDSNNQNNNNDVNTNKNETVEVSNHQNDSNKQNNNETVEVNNANENINKNEENKHPEEIETTDNNSEKNKNEIQATNKTVNVNYTENNTSVSNDKIIPKNIVSPMGFSFMPQSPYSETNPIPINPPLPEGLVFKVQIGAFNSPVKTDAFNGLSPVSAEKLEGVNIIVICRMFFLNSAANMVAIMFAPGDIKIFCR
jgi:hypothetical protein